METRPLKIEDINNKLDCFGFTVINFAPPPGSVREEDFNRLYLVQRDQKTVMVKLVDFCRIPFGKIGSILTIPATGFESKVWAQMMKQRHPSITDQTEMAVYCYIKQQ